MTTKQFFGEFLIERGLIDIHTLLAVLIDQIRSQKSIAEIVFDKALIDERLQLEILRIQSQDNVDYQQACIMKGVWNDDLVRKIHQEIMKDRVPLGQLLLARGVLKFADLTKALDEYVSRVSDNAASPQPIEPPRREEPPASGPPVPSKPESKTQPEKELAFVQIETKVVAEFLQTLSDQVKVDFKQKLQPWPFADDGKVEAQYVADLQDLLKHIRAFRNAARFVRATKMEHLLSMLELILERAGADRTYLSAIGVSALKDLCLSCIDEVWKIRGTLIKSRSEAEYWANDANRNSFERLVAAMNLAHVSVAA